MYLIHHGRSLREEASFKTWSACLTACRNLAEDGILFVVAHTERKLTASEADQVALVFERQFAEVTR